MRGVLTSRGSVRASSVVGGATLPILVCGLLAWGSQARAQSTLRMPDERPQYHVELEPHLALALPDPPGPGTGWGYGLGVRGTFEIVRDGFIGSIDDSVAIGVGLDFAHFDGDGTVNPGSCKRFVPGPAGR